LIVNNLQQSTSHEAADGNRPGYGMPVMFLLLAGWMLADPMEYVSPVGPMQSAPASATDTTPVRQPILHPETQIAGYRFHCSECHDLFPSPAETFRTLTQHRQIELDHGINTRCFNCHHPANRDALIDDFGQPIPYHQPQKLCAKCHGPVYNDWMHGSHGRTNGYWDESLGLQIRRKCIECHDPHTPRFQSMKAAPPPNTLRMGDPEDFDVSHERTRNPLLIYKRMDEEEVHPVPSEGGQH
jgi:hypothetical protein